MVLFGNHECVTLACRKDIEKRYMVRVLVDFLRWDFIGNNLAENTIAHGADANRAIRSRAIV